ncbi:MAG TPA: AAA family ATPase [Acidimicrobiia bacterium]
MLDIRLLGSPQVTVDGVAVDVDTRKAIAMLAYLAIETSAERDTLAALFWADSPPDRARATLRRTLSALRGGVGEDAISADRNRVELTDAHTSDIDEFVAAIESTANHGHEPNDVCDRCIEPLTRAAGLYRGDFLGAFAVRDAPEFEDWARPVTESLRLRAGEVYQRLAMAHASVGDYSAAIDVAGSWVSLDELHEPAHRLLMLLNAWAGDRPGAIQAYRDCVAILDRELGVSPLEETTELFEAILDEDLPPAPGVRRRVKTVRSTRSPVTTEMIDRREEVEALGRSIEAARSRSQLCVITGDSWMGKTRLVEEVTDQARTSGFATVAGRAFRAETKLPYGVATQWLKQLTDVLDGTSLNLAPWVRQELARLDPKLAPGEVGSNSERFGQLRLREAFLELVRTTGSQRPLVMSIDDAQWIDSVSASLISYLQRRLDNTPALVVLAARQETSLHPAIREMVGTADTVLHLEPLQAADISSEYPNAEVASVIAATGGVPLLVREALESGSVAPDSASVTRYMETRRQRLSDLSRQVLAAAAVLNGMCDAPLLRDTSGRTDDEIVDAVEELISAGLLREESDGLLGFTLDVLETVTYESTSLIRRLLLHRRAADALQSRARSRSDARLASATARHLRAAGNDEAAEWYRLSGDLTRAIFANDEAVSAYETAIALGHPEVGSIRLALGELAMARGDYETAKRELRAAASQTTGPELAVVEHRIGDLNRILGRFELAEESFVRSRADHPNPADLYADWALLDHRTGDTDSAIAFALLALEAAGDADDEELLARALNILGVVTPDTEEAMAHIDNALEVADAHEPARMAALNSKAHLLADSGDPEAAIPLVVEAISIADKAGYRHHQAALLNHLADLNHQVGRQEEAQQSLTEAVTLFADIAAGDWEPEVWLLREW